MNVDDMAVTIKRASVNKSVNGAVWVFVSVLIYEGHGGHEVAYTPAKKVRIEDVRVKGGRHRRCGRCDPLRLGSTD
jgi:hypothetical protein